MLSDSVADVIFLGARICKHSIEGPHLGHLSVRSLMLFPQLARLDGDLRSDGCLNPGIFNPLEASQRLIHRQVLRISGPLLDRALLRYLC